MGNNPTVGIVQLDSNHKKTLDLSDSITQFDHTCVLLGQHQHTLGVSQTDKQILGMQIATAFAFVLRIASLTVLTCGWLKKRFNITGRHCALHSCNDNFVHLTTLTHFTQTTIYRFVS